MNDNPFSLANIQSTAAAAPPRDDNPFSLRNIEADQRQTDRLQLQTAVAVNPDEAAEAAKLAQKYPAPPGSLLANLRDVRLQDAVDKADAQLGADPRLARIMRSKPWLREQSHDDFPVLTQIGGFFSDVGGALKAGVYTANRGAAGTIRAGLEVLSPALDFLEPVTEIGGNPLRRLAEGFGIVANNNKAIIDAARPKAEGDLAKGFFSGVESISSNALALPLAFFPGGQGAALSVMSAGAGGNAYEDAREKGLGVTQSLGYGVTQGAIEFLTEKLPLGALIKDVKVGTNLFATIAKQIALEIPGEQAATILQDLSEWATLNPDKPFSSYLEARPSAAAQTLVATIVGAGGNIAIAKGIEASLRVGVQDSKQIKQAEDRAVQLQQVFAAATASKLRERNPETFAALVQQMADETENAPTSVFIDAEVLQQAVATIPLDELAQTLPTLAAKLAEGYAPGSLLELPIGEVMAAVPGSALEQTFLDYSRADEDSPTLLEAKEASTQAAQFLAQEADRVIAQAADSQVLADSAERVKATILTQLNGLARFKPDVNDAYSTLVRDFYTAISSRTGQTPEQLFAKYPLRIAGGGKMDASTLAAGRLGEIAVEGYQYSSVDRPVIDTAAFGTGLKGSSRDTYLNAEDKRLRKRAYFYVDKGTGINPEAGVGGRAMRANLTNVYDSNSDPLRLKEGRDQLGFESAVLDAGFSGYLDRLQGTQSGQVILLGDQRVQAETLGGMGKTTGRVVPLPAARPSEGRDAVVDALRARKDLPVGEMPREGWDLMLSRLAPDQHMALKNAGVFEGDGPVYLSQLIRDFIANTEAPSYQQRAEGDTTFQKRARELLAATPVSRRSAAGFINGTAKTPRLALNFDIARYFTERNAPGMEDPTTPAAQKKIVDALYSDALQALTDAGSAVGWYDAKVTAALDIMAEVHPEILTDPQAKFGFIVMLAITSNSTDVNTNFDTAESLYAQWKTTGVWPTEVPATKASANMNKGLAKIADLVTEHGWEAVRDFMVADHDVGQIIKYSKLKIAGELRTSKVYGAVFLGSKIGAFFNNLYGNFTPVTMDRWFMRSINRVRGNMLALPENFAAKVDKLELQLADPALDTFGVAPAAILADIAAYRAMTPEDQATAVKVVPLVPNIMAYSKARLAKFAKGGIDANGKQKTFLERTSENMLAKALYEGLTLDEQTPEGGADRAFLRGIMLKLQQKLQNNGIPIVMADLQAVLWYYEKDLFAKLKGELPEKGLFDDATDDAEDYETAARRTVARLRGDPGVTGPGNAGRRGTNGGRAAKRSAAGPVDTTGSLFQLDGDLNAETGNGAGRYSSRGLAPLEGAPTVKGGGPNADLVAIAERYASANGITFRRQAAYAGVDTERATRIAEAFAAMADAPQDPVVAEAYQNMIQQTTAQYQALVDAGYSFTFFDQNTDPYEGNPWNAMRDLRATKSMAVYGTYDGYGAGGPTAEDLARNPMLADTGMQWPDQNGTLRPVTANDLFRAVHDAFGHGLEGAGFRAEGEENAWQAHVRLFTGSAIRAVTAETRGQNSYVNFGPDGETNKAAKVENTAFAAQKVGLLPEWVSTEGLVPDEGVDLNQGPRGTFSPTQLLLTLNENADFSTFLHESGHFFLEVLADIGSQPGAPVELAQDMGEILSWFGIKDDKKTGQTAIAKWNAMTLDEKRPHHERWAESFEQYLFEGKAPSPELRAVFQRFRSWLTQVYKSLSQFLRTRAGTPGGQVLEQGEESGNPLGLSRDIRQVMDRMLATDDQIAEAERLANFEAVFKSAEEAGMTLTEWKAYQELNAKASNDAIDELQTRSLRDMQWASNAKGKALKALQREAAAKRKEVEAEVTAEVEASAVEQARDYIRSKRVSSPADRDALKDWRGRREAFLERAMEEGKAALLASPEAEGVTGLKKGQLLTRNKKLLANEAERKTLLWERENPRPTVALPELELATVAERFGYTSVDHLLKDLAEQPPAAEIIEGVTDQRMLERYGDLIDARAIDAAANEAVHNEARARFVATELAALSAAMGVTAETGRTDRNGKPIRVNTIMRAAKGFAEQLVSRRKIGELKPSFHTAAERRAAKRALQAQAKGDQQGAAAAKRDQLLNSYAAKYTGDAKTEVDKAVDYLRKFEKDSVRQKLAPEYTDQIDKLLERFDLRRSTSLRDIDKRASLVKWIEAQQKMGVDPVIDEDLVNEAYSTSYKELTVEQFRGLVDAVKNIEHLGRLKSKLLKARDKREFDAIATEIADGIRENGGKPRVVGVDEENQGSKVIKWFRGAWAAHRKLNSLVRQMDGGKDNGAFYKAFIASMNEAGAQEDQMVSQATEALAGLYKPLLALPGGLTGSKSQVFIPEINASLTRAGRLAVVLNWGNPQNRQRLLSGDKWTEDQALAIIRTLGREELAFVNKTWEYLDSFWPEVKAKQLRVTGVAEDKVEAVPFELTLADGTTMQMRGGYYPIAYDPARSLKAERDEAEQAAKTILDGARARPTTRRGHTKPRAAEVQDRPVRKSLNVITQHVTQVTHDLAWHEWFLDANKLLNDPRIASAIRDQHGAETLTAMSDSVNAIAVGDVAVQTQIDQLALKLRSNISRSVMGASLTTALLQPFGLTQSMARIGVVPVLKGAARWAGDASRMESSMTWIAEKSPFMANRAKTFNRELREISQRVNGKSKAAQVLDASLFFLMQKLQMVADVPTWIGAYEKALNEGADEQAAVGLADEAVLGSQGGGTTKDLAGVQRTQPFLTQFYSYFNTTLNLMVEKTGTTDFKNPKAVMGWVADMALLAVIPAILPALITYLLKGGGEDDEPEDWAQKLLEWQAGYMFGLLVGLREAPVLWSPFDYTGPPAGRIFNDAKKLAQQAEQGEVDEPLVLAMINVMGSALGLPTVQLTRSYKGWKAWEEGEAPATSILFGPPPKD